MVYEKTNKKEGTPKKKDEKEGILVIIICYGAELKRK